MPVKVEKRGKLYRVVESESGQLAKNRSGSAVDGGGHAARNEAQRQVRAINAAEKQRDKK